MTVRRLAWTFAWLGKVMGRRTWRDRGRRIVLAHAPDAAVDPALDLISGARRLSELRSAVARMSDDAALVAALHPCVESLCARADALPAELDAGLAHGRAGVGWALVQSARTDGDTTSLDRAFALIEGDIIASARVRDGAKKPGRANTMAAA